MKQHFIMTQWIIEHTVSIIEYPLYNIQYPFVYQLSVTVTCDFGVRP